MEPMSFAIIFGPIILFLIGCYILFVIVRAMIRNIFMIRPSKEEMEEKAKTNKAWSRLLLIVMIIAVLIHHFG